jgi:20S proteasome alpha/beta subunit
MTIAAGFRCGGGIIFGADTYESVGDLRDRVHKIPSIVETYCTAMLTGSCSDGHLMDALTERLFDAIHGSRPTTHVELGGLLRDTVLRFYEQEMRVFPERNNSSISLLIAARLPAEDEIEAWSMKSSVVRRMQDYEVLGIGVYVRHVLRHLYDQDMGLDDGAMAMTLLLSIAKQRLGFVGGDCYISALTPTGLASENATLSSPGDEAMYDYFLSTARRLVLATGNARLTEQQYENVLKEFGRRMKNYRERLITTSSASFRTRLREQSTGP